MALTKLTKHVVHGATIVQVRYKDLGNLDTAGTSEVDWGSMTLTPEYSDSILEVRFNGILTNPNEGSGGNNNSENPRCTLFLDINGQNEYTVNDAASFPDFGFSYNNGASNRTGRTVALLHRHHPGTTNLQTITIQVSRDNSGGGNLHGRYGFLMAKELAGGVTLGTPNNRYTN